MIPAWLKEQQPLPATAECGTMKNATFLEKTIRESARLLQESVFNETYARADGFLQALETRCKLLAFLALIVSVSLLRSPPLVWGLYFLILVLAFFARVGLGFFLKRVWLAVPLFSLFIILPATLNMVTPGTPLCVLAHFSQSLSFGPYHLPAEIAVTREGVSLAILFVGRVTVSVSLAALLTLSTPWDQLMKSLRAVKVPAIFILTMTMAYRYLFMLATAADDMHLARKSRTVRYRATREEQQWVAAAIGLLFRKSFQASNDVHTAMISRGFSGDVRSLGHPPATWRDYAGLAATVLLCLLLVAADRLLR